MNSRVKAMVYMLALFAAGGICGAVVMHHFSPPQSQPLVVDRADEIAAKIRAKLTTKLSMTPAQAASAEPFIRVTATNLDVAHRTCLDQIDLAIVTLHKAIYPTLNDEQKTTLTEMDRDRAATMWQKYHYHSALTNSLPN